VQKPPEWLVDLLWPHVSDRMEECRSRVQLPRSTLNMLGVIQKEIDTRCAETDERHRLLNARLVSFLGMMSVLSAALSVGITFALSNQLKDVPILALVTILMFCLYVGSQLVRALTATVSGLSTRGFRRVTPSFLVPKHAEKPDEYLRRILSERLEALEVNESVLNHKTDDVNVAVQALRNVLGGSIALAIIATITLMAKSW
jgi:hypothetical protein